MAQTNDCLLTNRALEKYYLPTMYSLEFILGVIGNAVAVFGYIFCLKKWKSGNIYLLNLSISDLLFLCTLPVLVNSYSQEQWAREGLLCHSNRFLLHANLYSSVLFLTAVSADRCLLVTRPFGEHLLQRRRAAVAVSAAIWGGVILELLPLLHFLEPPGPANDYKCLDYASSGDPARSLIYSLFLTVFGFLVPLLAMCCFYVRMARFLRSRREQPSYSLALHKGPGPGGPHRAHLLAAPHPRTTSLRQRAGLCVANLRPFQRCPRGTQSTHQAPGLTPFTRGPFAFNSNSGPI
uniref:G-protein coupled receptors family 1 profile domain-containing protein n=1 Tax=Malurus cyaneus samueli TaxID=2593467 RepID=A0A8C5U532_9PASS